jgi:acetyl esterase/lipase
MKSKHCLSILAFTGILLTRSLFGASATEASYFVHLDYAGPFPEAEGIYGPEKSLGKPFTRTDTYPGEGQDGAEVVWRNYGQLPPFSDDPVMKSMHLFNYQQTQSKGACTYYLHGILRSDKARQVGLILNVDAFPDTTPKELKLWVNGKPQEITQGKKGIAVISLQAGKNEILAKVRQDAGRDPLAADKVSMQVGDPAPSGPAIEGVEWKIANGQWIPVDLKNGDARFEDWYVRTLIDSKETTRNAPQTTGTSIPLSTGAEIREFAPSTASSAPSPAIIVIPGGAYMGIADGTEGTPIAQWFASKGFRAYVLYYHAPAAHPQPLNDAIAAMRYVRSNAGKNNINPNKIGIIGFSAGGHLAGTLSNFWEDAVPGSTDPLLGCSSKPDFAILVYPCIDLSKEVPQNWATEKVRNIILGGNESPEKIDGLSLHKQVSKKTPPTFLSHGDADKLIDIRNSNLYRDALAAKGIANEMVVEKGLDHGYGGHQLQNTRLADSALAWINRLFSAHDRKGDTK